MELRVPSVHCEVSEGVSFVTLASADTGNALDAKLLGELREALERVTAAGAGRAIVLGAEGPDFSRGLDLHAFAGGGRPSASTLRALADCLLLIVRSQVPVIARVEQSALGGGLGLVAACDMVLAAPRAVFSLPEPVVGMIPALVSPVLLRRLTPGRLQYLALSTRTVGAAEALALGLVDELVEGDMDRAVTQQLQRVLRSSPEGLAEIKRMVTSLSGVDLAEQLEGALARLLAWLDKPGASEGIQAFADGLAPAWFTNYRGKKRV